MLIEGCEPLIEERDHEKEADFSQRTGLLIFVFVVSLLLTAFVQERSGSHRAELSGYPDEPSHYVTGLMIREYLHEGHFESPVRFAEDYYLHYPKVAIGHWPPLYYLAQWLWTVVFPPTSSSELYLQAVLLAVTSTLLFTIAEGRFGIWVACLLCGVFLTLHPTQELGSEIMSEPLLALTTLWAAWSIARYFETLGSGPLIAFVVAVELAAHTKGSGIALVGVPAAIAIGLGRKDILRSGTFWLAQLAMILILTPWQVFTLKMVSNGSDGPISLRLALTQLWKFGPISVTMLGWPLLILVLCGICIAVLPGRRRDPLFVSCAITAASTFLFHCVSPSGTEERRLFMALPEALLLAPLPCLYLVEGPRSRKLACSLLFGIAAISLLTTKTAFHKTVVGYRTVAGWLLANDGRGKKAVLVASDIDGEGMLISEIAQSEPEPSMYVVRSSKLFEDCDWQRHHCILKITDPARAEQVIDSIPIRYVILDHFSGIPSSTSTELVRQMIAARPEAWILRETQAATAPGSAGHQGQILVYQRFGLDESDQVHISVDLHRMIGKVVGN
jgi:hypothetical protein